MLHNANLKVVKRKKKFIKRVAYTAWDLSFFITIFMKLLNILYSFQCTNFVCFVSTETAKIGLDVFD